MIKQEWKNIFHNTWIKIVLVALIAIPSIYTVVFLGSMWDPYGNSGDLPVAVVNEDKAVVYNDKNLNVGKELVNKLKDNDSLDFHFVSQKKAMSGLKDGDYYMVITIPSNFSKNATTLLDKEPQKMILKYTTNPGTNYVASKMDDSAIAKIKAEVSSSVTKTYAETIFTSIGTMSDGFAEASDGTQQLSDGMSQLKDGNKTISDNLKVLASSSLTFKDGTNTLTKGLKDYTDGVVTVNNGVYQLKDKVGEYTNYTKTASDGASQLNSKSQDLVNGVKKLTEGVQQVQGVNSSLTQGLETLSATIEAAGVPSQEELTALSKEASTFENVTLPTIKTSTQQLKGAATSSNQTNASSKKIIDQLYASGKIDINEYTALAGSLQYSNVINESLLGEEGNSEKPGLLNTTDNLATKVNELSKKSLASAQGVAGIQQALTKVSADPVNDQKNVGLIQASKLVDNGLSQVSTGLTDKKEGLLTGVNNYVTAVGQISNGLTTLTNNNKALNEAMSTLNAGTSTLVSNNGTLMSGANQLADGAGQISDGAGKLAAGSDTLGEGITTAADGVTTLNDALKSGAEESKIDSTNKTTDMVAAPVDTKHKEISKVENNGHAMAPYMMSVGLYVTCLAFALMYPLRHGIKKAEDALKYWASKATVMYTVSTLAAIIMVTALRLINGFEPVNLGMTYLLAILVSAAFMSLVILLSLTTGYIGDFLLLVFMIVNLGGSAGTYPLETGPMIYKVIHKFVPYTYSVDGFRKVISMTNPSLSAEIAVFVGIIVVCSVLTVVYFKFKNKENKHVFPQVFEEVNGTKSHE
ncbi:MULTISPECIES: YhgE/Pip domain-containing protein [Coprobacillaceae]|uniref:YhgE/Pip domain-containing protein n=1 Tax=Coprobacillaceae TaxID=2810280 RepID=UPI000E4ADE83|nr:MULTISPECIES: YhgE/Pip domain-containing protein [Coprobacillaceae]RHM60244.1 YhgE/Pip domain-containing protein [Coprobacillus sp. AF33-1AC]RHS93795.1 YhgE/Pip domain-containing protein [Erysipelatoclostridium sp. AM42-17]